jgi:hypothetical protein
MMGNDGMCGRAAHDSRLEWLFGDILKDVKKAGPFLTLPLNSISGENWGSKEPIYLMTTTPPKSAVSSRTLA